MLSNCLLLLSYIFINFHSRIIIRVELDNLCFFSSSSLHLLSYIYIYMCVCVYIRKYSHFSHIMQSYVSDEVGYISIRWLQYKNNTSNTHTHAHMYTYTYTHTHSHTNRWIGVVVFVDGMSVFYNGRIRNSDTVMVTLLSEIERRRALPGS